MNAKIASLVLCAAFVSCRPLPSPLSPTASQLPTRPPPTPAPTALLATPALVLPTRDRAGCSGEVATSSQVDPPLDPGGRPGEPLSAVQLGAYLSLVGLESLCIPSSLGHPTLNVDWNDLAKPPVAIGRMISVGFDQLRGDSGGWGRGYVLYSTYDFEVGSEYQVFATDEDFRAVQTGTTPHPVTVDGVHGFIRFTPGMSMRTQPVHLTYIFPFEDHYLAAVLTLGQYDPDRVDQVIAQMQEGSHPDLANPDISAFGELVSSFQFQ